MLIKIGFIGSEKAEIMQYLSRILYHLGKRVLLIDVSEDKQLTASIPCMEGLDSEKEIIDYRSVGFCNFFPKETNGYDYILTDFGFRTGHEEATCCKLVFYVSDLQKHHLDRINVPAVAKDSYLILKDVVKCKISPKFLLQYLNRLNPEPRTTIVLPFRKEDKKSEFLCTWDSLFKFQNTSGWVKDMLFFIVINILGQSENEVKKAFRKAERGK